MIRRIVGLFLLSMAAAVANPSFEQTAEKRLHAILGTQSIQKDTRHGGRLTMIHIPDSSREKVRLEMSRLFRGLIRLGTRDAIRVLAGFLDDERYVYEPGSDYLSATIAYQAARALEDIRDEHTSYHQGRTKRMQATARMASVVSSTLPARRRLIRAVRQDQTLCARPGP
jgi:hypothetical protein